MTKIKNIIDYIIKDPYNYAETVSIDELQIIINHLNNLYYGKGQSPLPDNIYDLLKDRLQELDPDNELLIKVGHIEHERNKVRLPYHMGSMDKIKPGDGKLLKWKKMYRGPYVLADKLDGVSALFTIKNNNKNLYKRGSERLGTDITPLIPLIKDLVDFDYNEELAIRGELVMSKKNFKKYEKDYPTALSLVAGITNRKKVPANIMRDIDFVVYEVLYPRTTQSKQYDTVISFGFKTANYIIINDLDDKILSNYFNKRREISEYKIDGIIVTDDNLHEVNQEGNPEYAFAYKHLLEEQVKDVKVLDVEWNLSKHGYFKPTLILEPTELDKVIIKRVTAFNAKFIVDNKIGPGTIIKLTRSGGVIPYIVDIVKSTKAKMPDYDYKWNESKVDIYSTETDSKMIRIKKIVAFFKKLKIKYLEEKTVSKLINAGMETIADILNANIEDFEKVESFEKKMAKKVYNEIHSKLKDIDMSTLIAGSGVFRGIGERKAKMILKEYPNIIYSTESKQELIDKIINISGFEIKTAEQFVEGLNEFKNFVKTIPMITIKKPTGLIKNNKFKNMVIVFTGFRKKEWEKIIEEQGGKVTSSVSKNTNFLVTKDVEADSSKLNKARKLGISIMSIDDFKRKYKLT
jgi:NAD-dependent DNA ligase